MTEKTKIKKKLILINSNEVADILKNNIVKEVAEIIDNTEKSPHIAAILVGEEKLKNNSLSEKEKYFKEAGFIFSKYKYPASVKENDLIELINFLNNDDEINGLIIEFPLSEHISKEKIISSISPEKDLEGISPLNLGKLSVGLPAIIPPATNGIIELLKYYQIETEGKNCVIIANNNFDVKPLSVLLSQKTNYGNATVTLCNSQTKNLKNICASADILIAAIDNCEFVTADMIKNEAVVIDTGLHKIPSDENDKGYILKGDVKFNEVSKKASYITSVPDGLKSLNLASLMMNALKVCKE